MSHVNLAATADEQEQPLQDQSDKDPEIEIEIEEIEPAEANIITIKDAKNDPNPSQPRIDTQALNGLRGIVAIHIMVFHSLMYSELEWDILGSVQMPLFFLISGFIFGLSESKHKYLPTKCCTELKTFPVSDDDKTDDEAKHFDGKNYYQRRIARTLPLFYLTNLICIPLIFSGHDDYVAASPDMQFVLIILAIVCTIFVCSTWLCGVSFAFNGPSWFVSTIWFFYWCFPSLLPKLQRIDNDRKPKWICGYFWIQLIVGVVLIIAMQMIYPDITHFVATFWPISRLPVFIMGVLAGLLRADGLAIRKSQNEWTQQKWAKCANIYTILQLVMFIGVSVVNIVVINIQGNTWLQLIVVYWQIDYVVALTFEGGQSLTYKILTSKTALFLGRISYAIYLIHQPLLHYITWIVYGPINQPDCGRDECEQEWNDFDHKRLIPAWSIPILWVVSFIAAIILNRLFEEPMRKCLRPKRT